MIELLICLLLAVLVVIVVVGVALALVWLQDHGLEYTVLFAALIAALTLIIYIVRNN